MNTLEINGVLDFQNFINKGHRLTTTRQGGLYHLGNFVTHDDVSELAERLGTTPPELHKQLIALAFEHQNSEQRKLNRADIFRMISDDLKGFEPLPDSDVLLQLAKRILRVAEDHNILIHTNARRSWLMTCADEAENIIKAGLEKVFSDFMVVAGLEPKERDGEILLGRVLHLMITE